MRILCGLDSSYTGEVTLSDEVEEGDNENGQHTEEVEGGESGWVGREGRDGVLEGERGIGDGRGEIKDEDRGLLYQRDALIPPRQVQSLGHSIPESSYDGSEPDCLSPLWFRNVALLFASSVMRGVSTVSRGVRTLKQCCTPVEVPRTRRCVGWCAQEDALFDYLSVREHVELFDSLLGGSCGVGVGIATAPSSYSSQPFDVPITDNNDSTQPDFISTQIIRKLMGYFSIFSKSESEKSPGSATLLFLSRLGLSEHSEKMAMELSGKYRFEGM